MKKIRQNKAPWTAAEREVLLQEPADGAAVRVLRQQLGSHRSRSAVWAERQRMEVDLVRARLERARAAIRRQVENVDRWLKDLRPADPVESKAIYDQLRAALED